MENDDEDKYVNVSDDDPHANLIMEVIKNDSLRRLERIKKHESENHILISTCQLKESEDCTCCSGDGAVVGLICDICRTIGNYQLNNISSLHSYNIVSYRSVGQTRPEQTRRGQSRKQQNRRTRNRTE